MAKQSAGILLYRIGAAGVEVLLVHPGGPFFKNKDDGSWTIPKGEFLDDEDGLAAAIREFEEETGFLISGDFLKLKPVKLKSGKTIYAWAITGDVDAAKIVSNTFEMEWPPKSGKKQDFPEVDRGEWLGIKAAKAKINAAQILLLDELEAIVLS